MSLKGLHSHIVITENISRKYDKYFENMCQKFWADTLIKGAGEKDLETIEMELDLTECYCRTYAQDDEGELSKIDIWAETDDWRKNMDVKK